MVWRSAKALFDAGFINPGNIRELIARVYDEDSLLLTRIASKRRPATLSKGKALGRRSVAAATCSISGKAITETTRFGCETTKFRRGWKMNRRRCSYGFSLFSAGKIVPWIMREADTRRAWALSEVSIAQRHANGVPEPSSGVAALAKAATAEWGKRKADIPLLVLELADGEARRDVWRGRVTSPKGERTLLYDKRLCWRSPRWCLEGKARLETALSQPALAGGNRRGHRALRPRSTDPARASFKKF